MRKPLSINCVAKKAALGAMLASSVAMFASNPIKNEKTETQPKTEVVSKDGAEALKAITFPMLQQNPKVPTAHNKALDEKFMKLSRNDEEKKLMEDFLLNVYKNCGSYLASAKIQQELDLNMFYEFLDGNIEILKIFDENAYNKIDKESMKKVTEKSEPIKKWLDENYLKVYYEPLDQFDHPPDIQELKDALDDYVEYDPNKYFKDGFVIYRGNVNLFFEKLKKSKMPLTQKYSNLIAYEVNTADYILFLNLLKNAGIYKRENDDNILDNFLAYINAVQPRVE